MKQWMVIFRKEMLESVRSWKLLWLPVVFMLIAGQQPITMYYMPQILDSLGNLPEGAIIQLPTPTAAEVLAGSLSQYNMLGVLIVVLSVMGIIAAERKSGVLSMIFVKPVSSTAYITAKWLHAMLLIWLSLFVGYLFSWYYTGILFAFVPFFDFLQSYYLYGLWLSLILTLTIFLNTFMKSPGGIAAVALGAVILLTAVSGTFSDYVGWSPALISGYVNSFLINGNYPENMMEAAIMAAISCFMLIGAAIAIFRSKEIV